MRLSVIPECARFGDWEADLIIGEGLKQALVAINGRTSRHHLLAHVSYKTAQAVVQTMIALLAPFSACVHMLTINNGREFAQYDQILPKYWAGDEQGDQHGNVGKNSTDVFARQSVAA